MRRELDGRCGLSANGEHISVEAIPADFDQHLTFFWHNARISPYFTLENRVNDQQPPDDIMVVSALTLGIMENLNEATALIDSYPWQYLREARLCAIRDGLMASVQGIPISEMSMNVLHIAKVGLKKRGLGEEKFLDPLWERLEEGICPADMAANIFESGGERKLIEQFRL